ncbi:hypothetical protein L1887_40067 [Cichorium endivia]|nr:hypothetical protein L1887_40067 [Cichorium endivia]
MVNGLAAWLIDCWAYAPPPRIIWNFAIELNEPSLLKKIGPPKILGPLPMPFLPTLKTGPGQLLSNRDSKNSATGVWISYPAIDITTCIPTNPNSYLVIFYQVVKMITH